MSQHDKHEYLLHLSRIERLLNDRATSYAGDLTPHKIIEVLKKPCQDHPELTELGRFIRGSLSDKSKLKSIRWVVFHFDVPVLGGNESTTRNWVSVRVAEQVLLNEIHEPIGEETDLEHIYYAPSVLSKRLKQDNEISKDQQKRLLEKIWLYHLDEESLEDQQNYHTNSCYAKTDESGLLCFSYDNSNVYVFSCNNDHHTEADCSTLGQLLSGEDENEVRKRFLNFVNAIRIRKSIEFTKLKHENIQTYCNFYARIPIFFGSVSGYMTEVFIAFHDSNKDKHSVVNTLKEIESPLRLCVSLINSQIAYSIGHLATIQERLQEQRHTIFNSWPAGLLRKALRTDNPIEINKLITDALKLTDILETSFSIACDHSLPEDFPKSPIEMLKWFYERQQSRKKQAELIIDDRCHNVKFPDEDAMAAFTVLWNLWDNAEKVSHFEGANSFIVRVEYLENINRINITYENQGVIEKEWQDFLLLNRPLATQKKEKSGLMIVKKKLFDLAWTINEVAIVDSGKTRICISIPYDEYLKRGADGK